MYDEFSDKFYTYQEWAEVKIGVRKGQKHLACRIKDRAKLFHRTQCYQIRE